MLLSLLLLRFDIVGLVVATGGDGSPAHTNATEEFNFSINTITKAFLDYCSSETDPRTMFLLTKLVEHLHGFTKEVELTHKEWRRGLQFLYEAGQISSPERNEFVLASDVTGLSSLVDMIGSSHGGTSSSVLGPFHITGAPELQLFGEKYGSRPFLALLNVGASYRKLSGPILG